MLPVFGVPARSYAGGGVAGRPPQAGRPGEAGWPGRAARPGKASRSSKASRRVRTAFVLGGGGNRGAVQVGMLRALTERGITPDLLVGTSIGAINAAAFAGAPTLEGVYLAAEIWRRLGTDDIFPRSRFHGSWRFLERRESVFSIDGLRKVVGGFLTFERLEDAPIPLVVVATRLEDGAEEWLSDGPALEAVLASAALPGMYPVVELGGAHYFDGGVLDNVALSAALAAGAEEIFVLLCGTVDAPAPTFTRPYEAMFSAFALALHGRLRRDLADVPPGVDVVVFEQPGRVLFDPRDFSQTDKLIEAGYGAAREVLDDYAAAVAARGGSRTRKLQALRRLLARPVARPVAGPTAGRAARPTAEPQPAGPEPSLSGPEPGEPGRGSSDPGGGASR